VLRTKVKTFFEFIHFLGKNTPFLIDARTKILQKIHLEGLNDNYSHTHFPCLMGSQQCWIIKLIKRINPVFWIRSFGPSLFAQDGPTFPRQKWNLKKQISLKGLSCEMDLAFDDMFG
jgi:hypothetical protein